MLVIATTISELKLNVIEAVVGPVVGMSTADAPLPVQPINSGRRCCHERIDYVKSRLGQADYAYIISIENGIDTIRHFDKGGDHEHFVDICYVVVETRAGVRLEAESYGIRIPTQYVDAARKATPTNYNELGFAVTAGSIIHQLHPDIPANNWMADPRFGSQSRTDQIAHALRQIAF